METDRWRRTIASHSARLNSGGWSTSGSSGRELSGLSGWYDPASRRARPSQLLEAGHSPFAILTPVLDRAPLHP